MSSAECSMGLRSFLFYDKNNNNNTRGENSNCNHVQNKNNNSKDRSHANSHSHSNTQSSNNTENLLRKKSSFNYSSTPLLQQTQAQPRLQLNNLRSKKQRNGIVGRDEYNYSSKSPLKQRTHFESAAAKPPLNIDGNAAPSYCSRNNIASQYDSLSQQQRYVTYAASFGRRNFAKYDGMNASTSAAYHNSNHYHSSHSHQHHHQLFSENSINCGTPAKRNGSLIVTEAQQGQQQNQQQQQVGNNSSKTSGSSSENAGQLHNLNGDASYMPMPFIGSINDALNCATSSHSTFMSKTAADVTDSYAAIVKPTALAAAAVLSQNNEPSMNSQHDWCETDVDTVIGNATILTNDKDGSSLGRQVSNQTSTFCSNNNSNSSSIKTTIRDSQQRQAQQEQQLLKDFERRQTLNERSNNSIHSKAISPAGALDSSSNGGYAVITKLAKASNAVPTNSNGTVGSGDDDRNEDNNIVGADEDEDEEEEEAVDAEVSEALFKAFTVSKSALSSAPTKFHVLSYIANTNAPLYIRRTGAELQVTDISGFPLMDVWLRSSCFWPVAWVVEAYGVPVLIFSVIKRPSIFRRNRSEIKKKANVSDVNEKFRANDLDYCSQPSTSAASCAHFSAAPHSRPQSQTYNCCKNNPPPPQRQQQQIQSLLTHNNDYSNGNNNDKNSNGNCRKSSTTATSLGKRSRTQLLHVRDAATRETLGYFIFGVHANDSCSVLIQNSDKKTIAQFSALRPGAENYHNNITKYCDGCQKPASCLSTPSPAASSAANSPYATSSVTSSKLSKPTALRVYRCVYARNENSGVELPDDEEIGRLEMNTTHLSVMQLRFTNSSVLEKADSVVQCGQHDGEDQALNNSISPLVMQNGAPKVFGAPPATNGSNLCVNDALSTTNSVACAILGKNSADAFILNFPLKLLVLAAGIRLAAAISAPEAAYSSSKSSVDSKALLNSSAYQQASSREIRQNRACCTIV